MPDCDNDVAFFVTLIHIPMGVNNLFKWIAPIDHRHELSRDDEIVEVHEISKLLLCIA